MCEDTNFTTVEFGYVCKVSGRLCKWNFVLQMCVECLSCENRAQLPSWCERESCLSIEICLERRGNAFRHGEVQCRSGFVDRPGYIDLVGHISRHVTC